MLLAFFISFSLHYFRPICSFVSLRQQLQHQIRFLEQSSSSSYHRRRRFISFYSGGEAGKNVGGCIAFKKMMMTTKLTKNENYGNDEVEDGEYGEILQEALLDETSNSTGSGRINGDPFKEATGIRPSTHPICINAIAESLKARAVQIIENNNNNRKKLSDEKDDDNHYFRVDEENGVRPLDVMITAGQFASDAIQKRKEASIGTKDGMELSQHEEQTVAGRVMGVIMRLDELERTLIDRVTNTVYVAKYDEWYNFGLLANERLQDNNTIDDNNGSHNDNKIHEQIRYDPLFCMNRAECLLGIFLNDVELPQLKILNETVPDGSVINFLDSDRLEVIAPYVLS